MWKRLASTILRRNRLFHAPTCKRGIFTAVTRSSVDGGAAARDFLRQLPRPNSDSPHVFGRLLPVQRPFSTTSADVEVKIEQLEQQQEQQQKEKQEDPQEDQKPDDEKLEDPFDQLQHEEITGPTVDRDMSKTANEVRHALDDMLKNLSKLKKSLLAMGAVQLLSGWYIVNSQFKAESLFFWFTGLSIALSLQLAHILYQTTKALPFFQKIEERSRMRVLTLSLQAVKSFSMFLGRSNAVVCVGAAAMLAAFAFELVPHLGWFK